MSDPLRIVVLASGEGSNVQALIDAIEARIIEGARVEALVCDVPGARCIDRAVRHAIPVFVVPAPQGARRGSPEREAYDERLAAIVASFGADVVMLLGWMRLLGRAFLKHFPGKVINLHPALPGAFPGTHAIERAFDAFRRGDIARTGIMLHLVPDEGVDSGPVLRVAEVPIFGEDTLSSLEARIHETEHREVVALVRDLALKRSNIEEKESAYASRIDIGV
ncbi:MAG: phosphoribosylglycinamide formyltransferase [Rectinema sp.]